MQNQLESVSKYSFDTRKKKFFAKSLDFCTDKLKFLRKILNFGVLFYVKNGVFSKSAFLCAINLYIKGVALSVLISFFRSLLL